MANLPITPANVEIVEGVQTGLGIAGEAVSQGQPIRRVGSTLMKSSADGSGPDNNSACDGVVLTPAAIGETVVYALPGSTIALGATLTQSETYVVSRTSGLICPIGDLAATDYVTHLGVAQTAALLLLRPWASNVKVPGA